MFKRVWKAMETKAGEIRVEKAEGKREETRKEGIEEEKKKKTKKGKNNRSEEDGRRMGDLG